MKYLLCFCLIPFSGSSAQSVDVSKIRTLYHSAPEVKTDARELNMLMSKVDSATAAPVLICYKGANEMIQAKYIFNPISKLGKFNKGKELVQKAINRNSLNLEMRFIRFSLQSNLPAFLAYHKEREADKQFLLMNTRTSKDPELKEMIINYLSALTVITPDELKKMQN